MRVSGICFSNYDLANIFASGLGKILETALLFGIDPPRASLVFLRYWISGESSGGLTYGKSSISASETGILNLSLKDLILSINMDYKFYTIDGYLTKDDILVAYV